MSGRNPARLGLSLTAALPWLLPPALLLAVWGEGLWVWFHNDDFTLLWHVRAPAEEFWPRLFEPRAQGTFRTLSERLFFFYFHRWFGLDAFPFRALAFATQIVNLWLLTALAVRLSGSRLTAALAGSLWALHLGMAGPMSWSSAYNQPLCAFFLLAALHLFVRFADSGCWGLYIAQWTVFLLGFGALESIVVYPALAAAYALLYRPNRVIWALPLFAGSAALAWLQIQASPPGSGGDYAMSLHPASLLWTLKHYIHLSLAGLGPGWIAAAVAGLGALGVAAEARRGRYLPLFGVAWFLATLAPYLPLRAHLSDYYLFIPSAGLALAGGALLPAAWRWRPWAGAAATALVCLSLWPAINFGRSVVDHAYAVSVRSRNLVTGLSHARARHPGKTILLTGIDEDFFYGAIYHDLFRLAGVFDVYLAPDSNSVRQRPNRDSIDPFILSREEALLGIARDSIAVYDASGYRLQEVTTRYKTYAPARLR